MHLSVCLFNKYSFVLDFFNFSLQSFYRVYYNILSFYAPSKKIFKFEKNRLIVLSKKKFWIIQNNH